MNTPPLQSKRFWTAIIDSLLVVFMVLVSHFWPENSKFLGDLAIALQAFFGVLVTGFTVENVVTQNRINNVPAANPPK
jgi:hypothetical protein